MRGRSAGRPRRRAPSPHAPGAPSPWAGAPSARLVGGKDEAGQHLLAAGLVELDVQLVAVGGDHGAVAELLVEDAGAALVTRAGSGWHRPRLRIDHRREAAGPATAAFSVGGGLALGEPRQAGGN